MPVNQPKFERILVVIDNDQLAQEAEQHPAPLVRALSVARATGAEIEMFHACDDPGFDQKLFAADAGVAKEKEKIAERCATQLAALTLGLATDGVTITHDVRWDFPQTDAILRKIDSYHPDIVIKQADEHAYLLGLTTNVDWELVRRSPAHIWFVRDETVDIQDVVSAIGTVARDEDIISAADYDVFRYANSIAGAFNAKSHPVHAFQVPQGISGYAMYGPAIGGGAAYPVDIEVTEQARREVAEQHGALVRAFAEYFQLDPNAVQLAQGHPSDVLPEVARSLNADLIVMGARNLSRWQRMFKPVTAEPILSDVECEVLFVKEPAGLSVPAANEQAVTGSPAFDIEAAITHPERAFNSPDDVVTTPGISPRLRERILAAWDQDIQAQMREEEEGGPTAAIDPDLLAQIRAARERVRSEAESQSGQPGTIDQTNIRSAS